MIFGSPGTGKTTYLINLLRELLEVYSPQEIAFVSFTKKGSYEGRDRAIKEFNFKAEDFPYFKTIHAIAFKELGMSRYDIISKRHYKEFSTAMGMSFVGYYTEEFNNNDDRYLFLCSLEKNNKDSAERMMNNDTLLNYNKYKHIKSSYKKFKSFNAIKDFDDLLVDYLEQGKTLPVKVAIIDEAQDLTTLQWAFCNKAFSACDRVFIAGDDDQAIYEWSGADINQFLSFTNCSTVKILDKTWRLKKDILDYSDRLVKKITTRVDKKVSPNSVGGSITFYNNISEVGLNNEETYYLLSRNRFYLRYYKEFLYEKGIDFYYKDDYSIDLNIFNAIRYYENLRQNNSHLILTDNKLIPFLRKDHDFKKSSPVWYDALNLPIEQIRYYRRLFQNKVSGKDCKIRVDTIHGVKGGEADNVVLLLDMTKNVYNGMSSGEDKTLDSELRCLYVAMTRAKKNLHIVHSNGRFGYDDIVRTLSYKINVNIEI